MRRWIVAAAAAGLVLRLAFGLLYWTDQPLTHDEREYLALARSIARGDGLRYPSDEPSPGTSQRFGRAPGYPVFLAMIGVRAPADHVPARVKIAQSIVGACGILFIAAIAGRAFGDRAAIAAAAIAAVYPPLVWMPSYALSETLYSTLALAAAWMLARTELGHAACAAGAALTGIAILIRPAMLFFVPFGAAWIAVPARKSPRRGTAYKRAFIFILVTLGCVLPWTIRNHRAYGRWVLVASEGGVTFWTGNHPLAIGEGDLASNPQLKEADIAFRSAHPSVPPEQLEPLYYSDALAWIRAHPGAWIVLGARKLFFTIVPIGPSYALHSARYRIASAGSYLLLLPLAAAGAWRLRGRVTACPEAVEGARRESEAAAPLWLMAAATVVAGLVFFPQERFRIPVIDPALIVAASALADVQMNERISRRSHV